MKSFFFLLFSLTIITTSYAQTNLWQSSGNIGIGTTSPGASTKLEVVGSGLFSGSASSDPGDGSPAGTRIGFRNDLNYGFVQTMKTGVQYYPLALNPGGGYVGVGTVNPQTPLHVIGPITAGYDNSTWGVDYLYGAYGSGKLFVLGSQYSSGASFLGFAVKAKHLAVGYVSSTEITVPRAAIEASGEGVRILTGPSQTSSDGGAVDISERMRIDAAGNVGIGTTAPMQKLSVVGGTFNVGSEGDYYGAWLSGGQSVDSFLGLGTWHSQAGYIKWFNAARRLAIYTTSSGEPLTLQENGGNVGIGTTSPTEKLSVNGRIRAKEVIVDTGWSDYVFAKDYKLAPLSEVEQYIEQQGHLPGVPSAQEVAEKGVSVGDMQAILLAKIEELTLHQIAQEKELIAQRAKLEAQSTEIAALRAENSALKTVTK